MEAKVKSTRDVIVEQLTENTGHSLGDSGDAYGRKWQQNQGKTWGDFTREPITTGACVYTQGPRPVLEITGTISLAAWMDAHLEYAPDMQAQYDEWVEAHEDSDQVSDLALMEEFADELFAKNTLRQSDPAPQAHNSYNSDCDLSQTIQFVQFNWEDESYVLLRVHGGCDVRAGYTSPKAYRVYEGTAMFDWCVNGYWIDGGEWWDSQGVNLSSEHATNLFDYPVHDLVWVPTLEQGLEALKGTNLDTEQARETMRATAKTLEREYFEEFCDTLDEPSIVVWKNKAYLVEGEWPVEIKAAALGL